MRSIYLDYNATTPLAPAAQEAMLPYLADRFADPAAGHTAGRAIDEAIVDARAAIAGVLGSAEDEVAWTSGGTESCNLALRGSIEPSARSGDRPHLVVSAIDHAAVQGPARFLASIGAELTLLPVDEEGFIDPSDVRAALRPNTRLVSVVYADDELGSVQPIGEIASICRERGVLTHTDASQALGKLPVRVAELGVDLLSLSAHKAYGPKGVGALYARRGVELEPTIWGAGVDAPLRAGMPNVAGVVGFASAAPLADAARLDANERIATLRDRLRDRLLAGAPDAALFGPLEADRRTAGTLCVALPGVTGSDLLSAAREVHAMACGSGAPPAGVTLSPALRALGADPVAARGAVRLSLGWYTGADEVDAAADALLEAWDRLVRG